MGRALAEMLTEQAQTSLTQAVAEVGKFDAEQRERLRQFTTQVMERAEYAEGQAETNGQGTGQTTGFEMASPASPVDLQAMLDDLRAEIAQLRTELKQPRG